MIRHIFLEAYIMGPCLREEAPTSEFE